MNQLELREDLRVIQRNLRDFFPPEMHQIRQIKGGGYWVFLPHQAIRDRLDEVVPEWEISYSPIEMVGADVSVRCTIVILKVMKQSIGSVPLVAATNRQGDDVSRGSATDRVRAEAFKNAAEEWGVGRYLDDQAAVFSYLNSNATSLPKKTRAELANVKNYLRKQGTLSERGDVSYPMNKDIPVTKNSDLVTPEQASKLYAIAKSKGLSSEQIAQLCQQFSKTNNTKFVPKAKYQEFLIHLESLPDQENQPLPASIPDKNTLKLECFSLITRKFGLDKEGAIAKSKQLKQELFDMDENAEMTIEQLQELKQELQKLGFQND